MLYLISLFIFLVIRLPLIWHIDFQFDADEAVNAIMAIHIAQGKTFPIFMYGQSYMGAIDSWFAGLLMLFFEPSIALVRLVPIFSSIIVFTISFCIAKTIFKEKLYTFLLALLISLLPPYVLTQVNCLHGGRYFSVAFGALLYLLYFKYYLRAANKKMLFLMCIVAGFGYYIDKLYIQFLLPLLVLFFLKDFSTYLKYIKSKIWTWYSLFFVSLSVFAFIFAFFIPALISRDEPLYIFGFIRFSSSRAALMLSMEAFLVMLVPYSIYFIKNNISLLKKNTLPALGGFLLGYLPHIIYPFVHKEEVFGKANFYFSKDIRAAASLLWKNILEETSFISLYPKWSVSYLLGTLFLLVLIFVLRDIKVDFNKLYGNKILVFFLSIFISLLIFMVQGASCPGVRYLPSFFITAPFLIMLSVKALKGRSKYLGYLFICLYILNALFVINNYYIQRKLYTRNYDLEFPRHHDIKKIHKLIKFLNDKKIKYSFSNYWLAHVLTFVSGETHISSTPEFQWLRHAPYLKAVTNTKEKAYIYRENESEFITIQKNYKEIKRYKVAGYKIIMTSKPYSSVQ